MTAGAALVGRRTELRAIDHVLDRVDAAADGAILQFVGEPGIGKSRLLAQLSDEADRRGHLVLAGRAAELELELPFGVFVDALDDYLASLEPSVLNHFGPARLDEVATVFPALLPRAAGSQVALQDERYRTYRDVRALLDQLARARPLVLVLDDIHWADPASSELISYLLSHPPQGAVVLAVSFRPAQVPRRLGLALAASERNGESVRLQLAPLTPTEMNDLVGEAIPQDARAELYAESGGNPFYLEQLLRRGVDVDADRRAGPPEGAVPRPVAAALEDELACLPPGIRSLLEAASVAGDPVDALLAAAVADVTEAQAWDGLDLLVRRDLLRPTSVPGRFRFRHPIVRRAVYDATKASARRGAHARAAAALRRQGFAPAGFAHHLERSASVGDADAVDQLLEAATATLSRVPATAAHWYECALRILPDGEAWAERRLHLSIALAGAHAGAGRLAESRGVLREILRAPLPLEVRVGLVSAVAALESHLGHAREARSTVLAALGEVEDQHSADAARLQIVLAEAWGSTGDYDQTCHWAARAFGHRPRPRRRQPARLGRRQTRFGRVHDQTDGCCRHAPR